jgi:GH24 family phage-related lysozyme (muramidase)
MTWAPSKLGDFFANYDKNNPNHVAAAALLQSQVPGVMNDGAEWVKKFREKAAAKASSGARVPDEALHLIKKYEGFRAKPYICPAGVATIGYGNTFYTDGRKVTMSDPAITEAQALELLRVTADKSFVSVLEKKIPSWSEMSDGQKSALISFAYNLGAHFYGDNDNFGSITRALSSKANWSQVPEMLLKYRNPGSAFEEGLRKRRTEEGAVWKS